MGTSDPGPLTRGIRVARSLRDHLTTRGAVSTVDPSPRVVRWIVGRENKEALARYRQRQQETWRRRHPGRDDADAVPSRFPAKEDNFKLSTSAVGVTVVDEPSGAQWALAIPSR